jgi:hypothetical protein
VIARYRVLARRIQLELEELERTETTIQKHWQTARRTATDQGCLPELGGAEPAQLLLRLGAYLRVDRPGLDGGALGGDARHTELLRQMSLDLPDVRPAVLRPDTAARLDEYRKFRHRIRNIYATNLDADRMRPLVTGLPALWEAVRRELTVFAAFLTDLAGIDAE